MPAKQTHNPVAINVLREIRQAYSETFARNKKTGDIYYFYDFRSSDSERGIEVLTVKCSKVTFPISDRGNTIRKWIPFNQALYDFTLPDRGYVNLGRNCSYITFYPRRTVKKAFSFREIDYHLGNISSTLRPKLIINLFNKEYPTAAQAANSISSLRVQGVAFSDVFAFRLSPLYKYPILNYKELEVGYLHKKGTEHVITFPSSLEYLNPYLPTDIQIEYV
jgi:hypothetical protein